LKEDRESWYYHSSVAEFREGVKMQVGANRPKWEEWESLTEEEKHAMSRTV
jgi:hypothetical protein